MGINVDKYFSSSDSLKAADIPPNTKARVVIESCSEVEFKDNNTGKTEHKLRLSFMNQEKGLILNKTNAMTIAGLYGGDTDGWLNKEIFLYQTKVSFGDQMVDAIRVDLPMQTADMGSLNSYPEAQ